MSSAYALPLEGQLTGRKTSGNSNSTKSLVLSILMISMSLSTGIIELNQPTSDLEESPAEFDLSPISESISSVLASITELIWPTEDTGELGSSEAINTGARSTQPSITLSAGSVSLVYDIPMQAITPSNTGGAATSWSIDPTLPGGLSFDIATGEISGTPTALSPATDYTITATNSFGQDSAVIEISVYQQFPVIQYNPTSFTFNVGTAIANPNPITPNIIQGTGLTWTVSPSFPSGINLDASTGVISGTPSLASSQATYQVTATNSGGSDTVNLLIQVNDVPPSGIAYPQSTYTLTKGEELTPAATPTSSGGTVTSWSITPSLPSGLQFDAVTGVISGTPTIISASQTYTVTAQNSGGSDTTTLTFQVNDVAPTFITYNPSTFVETVDAAMSTLVTPTYSGGAVTSWTVTPSLPIGLSLDSNGVIYGTPTVVTSQTVYTITGSNTGGSDSTTVTIQVNDKAPVFYYSVTQIQMTKGQPQSLTPTVSNFGGAVVSYAVSPQLPNGLALDTITGEISGTPSDITASQSYTITASNSGGSSQRNMIIEVNDAQPVIGYSTTSYTFTKGTALPSTITPTDTGGTVVTWSIDPSLPNGLNFDISTGEISGNPTIVSASATYTVTAENTGGDDTVVLTIEVIDIPPASITYSELAIVETKGVAIIPVTATTTGGTVVTWSIDPALPNGLILDTSTGEISGTSTVLSTLVTYTITGTNTGGQITTTIDITVNDQIPSNIIYNSNPYASEINSAMTTGVPTVSGGDVVTWSISPNLPTGLSIDSSTGEISGTPTVLSTQTTYTVSAENTGGTATTTVDITVYDIVTSISYSASYILTKGTPATITPTNTGGAATSWALTGTLPLGLNFDTSTGVISGTPTELDSGSGYGVVGSNSNPSDSIANFVIVVNDEIPSNVAYSSSSFIETKGTGMTTGTPTANGGAVVSWEIYPSLPSGLNIDSSTGEISGTPTVISSLTTYTVYANNTGGSDSTNIDITVNDISPSGVSYSTTSFTETRGTSMISVTPTYNGGTVETWSINPALPTGITLDSSTGEISGTPTIISSFTTYTITATNTGGSDTTTIDITVYDIEPSSLTYNPNVFVLTVGTPMPSHSLTASGGPITGWTVSMGIPSGINFDFNTGEFSGTPTAVTSEIDITVTATNTGGSTTAIVTFTVNDVAPSVIEYAGNPFTLTKDSAFSSGTPTNQGGTVTSWSVSPTLPNGLSLDASTGVISGVPTDITSLGTYTITATNTGGVDSVDISIVVNDEIPEEVAYSPNSFVETKGTAMTDVTPTYNGGTVTSWAIHPALPSGLSIDATTGKISGNPTVLSTLTTYTVYANNTGGSATTTVDITVNDIIPSSITYTATSFVKTKGTPMTTGIPTVGGGPVVSWSINPGLPTGLNIDSSTGEISGTPSVLSTLTTYTITATNSGGSTTTTIDITVNDIIPSSVSYVPDAYIFTKGTSDSTSNPSANGGPVVSWEIHPTLPNGLSIDSSTGQISGTPTTLSTFQTYTVYANNSGGSATTTIDITVNDVTPSVITYTASAFVETRDSAMTTGIPTVGGGPVVSWSIAPALPTGLDIDVLTGEISGTPTVNSALTSYTVTATNSGGSATTTVDITVNDIIPSSITYAGSPYVETKDSAMSTGIPTYNGGTVLTWSVSPPLPTGLEIDASTGEISGTPTVLSALTTYTITATNTGGNAIITIDITVNDIIPSISYNPNSFVETRNSPMTATTPTVGGGAILTWSISPDLPTGLSLDPSTGELSGTPTVISDLTTYTITVTNTGGSATDTVDIVVRDIVPTNLDYTPSSFILTLDAPMGPVTPTAGGGPVVTWSVNPGLPTGLSIDSATGTISGIPTVITPSATYTITATNSGGSDSITITLEVNDVIPSNAEYDPSSFVETKGMLMTAVTPTAEGGSVTSWEIHPSLPTGLSIDSSTGEISGTPTVLSTLTTYTVYANNTGGSVTTTIDITVNDEIPSSVTYTGSPYVETIDSSMTTGIPTFLGGTVLSWEVHPPLPAGIDIDSSTGEISGTPTALSTQTTYTVYANNTGGSGTTTIDITVIDIIPSSVTYTGSPYVETIDLSMTTGTPTYLGGTVLTWEIHPALPTGLSIDLSTGEISGTPIVLSTQTTYTIYANNTGGSGQTTIDITVNDVAPSDIVYSGDPFRLHQRYSSIYHTTYQQWWNGNRLVCFTFIANRFDP
jgi:uncharacterized repeat protein (TIGR01451 family)